MSGVIRKLLHRESKAPEPHEIGVDTSAQIARQALAGAIARDMGQHASGLDDGPLPLDNYPPERQPARMALDVPDYPSARDGAMDAALLEEPAIEAATASLLELAREVAAGRSSSYFSGPTIEEMVREHLRPMLRAWVVAHMPALAEHLVRQEIERLVSQALNPSGEGRR